MPGELNELEIRQTALLLGLPYDFIRKDYFVTKALRLLVATRNDYFKLIFQGGTSLSKGYGVIKRLSEDVDFRIITTPQGMILGKDAKRRELRHFRHSLVDTLRHNSFRIASKDIRVFYEGRYMGIKAVFEDSHQISYLKPHIAIDCFLGTLELMPEKKMISSMTKVTLGEEHSNHDYFPVACVALDETAAEKWVALSRRIVDAKQTPRDSDKDLVRHLYDLHQLHSQQQLTPRYHQILERVIQKEGIMFADNKESLQTKANVALTYLQQDPQWESHWNKFLEQMVYDSIKPEFSQAIKSITELNELPINKTILEDKKLDRNQTQSITKNRGLKALA